MPSLIHEGIVEMFRVRPGLAAELLTETFGVPLPEHDAALLSAADVTDLGPLAYHADAVVVLSRANAPSLAVIVEVQLGQNNDKKWRWPFYLAAIRARLECPTILLVMCADTRTARWSARPIDLGHPGLTLRPLVIGPDRVPALTDAEAAIRRPELAVLSAMTHADQQKVLTAVISALRTDGDGRLRFYSDLILNTVPKDIRQSLEVDMPIQHYEPHGPLLREWNRLGIANGRIYGLAEAIMTVLTTRGLSVGSMDLRRIEESRDPDQLEFWLRNAVTATTMEEVLQDPGED